VYDIFKLIKIIVLFHTLVFELYAISTGFLIQSFA